MQGKVVLSPNWGCRASLVETYSMRGFCRTGGHGALGDRAGPAQHFALKHIVRGVGGKYHSCGLLSIVWPACGLRVACKHVVCVWPAIVLPVCGLSSCSLGVASNRLEYDNQTFGVSRLS